MNTKVVEELQAQAKMFDMEVDWELLTLVPKSTYQDKVWIVNWKNKRDQSDFDESMDVDRE